LLGVEIAMVVSKLVLVDEGGEEGALVGEKPNKGD
jgi:hypothetical protein